MKLIRVAAGVLNQTPLDWEGNARNIRRALAEARAQKVSVLCLPEMCITGYGCQDAFLSPGVQATALEMLNELLRDTRGLVVTLGLPLMVRNAVYNTSCLVVDGQIAGFVAKRFLAGDGIHYEPRWFKPWPEGRWDEVPLGDELYPVGDLYFDVGGVRMGFEICEDAWVANRPGAELALKGVDLFFNPSASHFAFDKIDVRSRFVIEGSRAFSASYVYANLVGNDAGRAIYDGGTLIASGGTLLARGPRFTFRDVVVTSAVIDVDDTRRSHAQRHSYAPDFDEGNDRCIELAFRYPSLDLDGSDTAVATWETGGHRKEEEFTRAQALALFDYMRRSYSNGFVVSLSGGADSAACACLVHLMVELAVAELGLAGFGGKLAYLVGLADGEPTVQELTHRLLTCAYQSTRNSSDTTRNAARAVAETVGARFLELDVDALVQSYVAMVSEGIDRELTWEHDDVTLQNIQARVRGPSVWMLANLSGALLVATSNRSEAAVGYATMDGDTCGGLSPIAGIDKAFLRQWLKWLETVGPDGLRPLPALEAVTVQAPTAELRPLETGQTDEGDLMPYPVLDAIERAAIRDKLLPVEAYKRMRVRFPDADPAQLGVWVERFFKLWCRNQWKRERYAPSFHVDDENLDPKTWCRFPILSSGFRRELDQLRDFVAHLTRGRGNRGPVLH